MTMIQFLAEWALRSSILILTGAFLLWLLRVKDPSIRLAAWTAMLFGSLGIPPISTALPRVPVAAVRLAVRPVETVLVADDTTLPASQGAPQIDGGAIEGHDFRWVGAAVTMYVLVALTLLVRLSVGLAIGRRLLRRSHATGQVTEGIEIRESSHVAGPVTLGIARPAIVLPGDWRRWDGRKLEAVLAHERSHVRRHDPVVQLLSAIHRALLWYSPLSWILHQRIVRVAEEASDDAAVAATRDRASYAEVLLEFMQRGVWAASWQGVPMARYGLPEKRIHRILNPAGPSRGLTRWGMAVILAAGLPLAYLVAAVDPQSASEARPAAAPVAAAQASSRVGVVAHVARAANPEAEPAYLAGIGNVAAFQTVTVTSRIDGQLMSVSFKEGQTVQAGQVLASIDARPYEIQLQQAESLLAQDQAQLNGARAVLDRYRNQAVAQLIPKTELDTQIATVAQLEGKLQSDQVIILNAKLQLSYAQILAPISGVVGLRLLDPGNIVHATDTNGILVINQLQPIAVLFTIPEGNLPQVLTRLKEGASLEVEAWNRSNSAKIAAGHLTAVDNQIDPVTGTAKLKAVFENRDGALFPNQFVNVRLFVGQ